MENMIIFQQNANLKLSEIIKTIESYFGFENEKIW